MSVRSVENNWACVSGELVSEPIFNHEVMGEKFYLADLAVSRLSEKCDILPLLLSEQLIDAERSYLGRKIEVKGQFRSFSRHDGPRNRLILSIFVREICFAGEDDELVKTNQIFLDGFICKIPVYRRTPLGREIADLFLAVNRPYGKSDYIPCIAWGKNARTASDLDISTRVRVWGRIQSREYIKKLDDENPVKRVAYEVSISRLESVGPYVDISSVSC